MAAEGVGVVGRAVWRQLVVTLRLYGRNPLALGYGYLFPTLFLLAFWVLYRHEPVPLIRHLGELLTVTALGGACFGLPSALVAERERGVWRRYRLTPVSTGVLLVAVLLARYLLLLSAALLQLGLGLGLGMPLPEHLLSLWVAFSLVSFAFVGLGLLIAMLADSVPAVQALGQSVFLPMLILGGVAVRLESLPAWAQHLSAFFPGRYAVEALQQSATGGGLAAAGFALLALALIGAAGLLAAAGLFRWEPQQRVALGRRGPWLAVALGAWVAVGLLAEARGRALAGAAAAPVATAPPRVEAGAVPQGAADPQAREAEPEAREAPEPGAREATTESASEAAPAHTGPESDADPRAAGDAPPPERRDAAGGGGAPPPQDEAATRRPAAPRADAAALGEPEHWQAVTEAHLRRIDYAALPPDQGVVAPIARPGEQPDRYLARQLECMRDALPGWRPARVRDPVQRARNLLFVAAVPDVFQMEAVERFIPGVVFQRLQQELPRDQLVQVLYWVATHPREGDESAMEQLPGVCVNVGGVQDRQEVRVRASIYAAKLLGRLTGAIR